MRTIVCLLIWAFLPIIANAVEKAAVGPPHATDTTEILMDGIHFETVDFHLDAQAEQATIKLTLINRKEHPRELRINVYGTQLVDDQRNAYYFSTIELGRVLMRFADRQNYLNYLLPPDTPVQLTITADGIASEAKAIQVVKIVFEDSGEAGRFLDVYLTD